MLKFVFKRLLTIIPVAIGVIFIVSILIHAVPGDPVDGLVGDYGTLEQKMEMRQALGLDKPLVEQISNYFLGIINGSLGDSLFFGKPVLTLILERALPTIELAIVSILVAIIISIPLGILSALFAGKTIDFIAMAVALIGVCMPNFWLGPLLILFFSIELDILPVSERNGWDSYILPAITMGTALAAVLSRMTRNSVLENLSLDYVRTARAKGVGEFKILFKHVLRNASLPLITIVGLQFGVLVTGAIITEKIFDWPGLGSLIISAIEKRDYPVVQGCVFIFSMSYLVINLVTDICYAWADPRIKVVDE